MVSRSRDIVDLLREEFGRRQRVNARYSLRAFARHLSVDPSSLSQILRRERALRSPRFEKIGKCLGLDPAELKRMAARGAKEKRARDRLLEADQFSLISEWQHYAILELTVIKDFSSLPEWISERLGLTRSRVVQSVERLIRLGLLSRDDAGTLTRTEDYVTTHHHPFSTVAFRSMQKQVLDLARGALADTDFSQREQCTLAIAARTSDLPVIRQKIRKFHRSLNDWIERRGDADEVYHLVSAYYPVTGGDRRNKKVP